MLYCRLVSDSEDVFKRYSTVFMVYCRLGRRVYTIKHCVYVSLILQIVIVHDKTQCLCYIAGWAATPRTFLNDTTQCLCYIAGWADVFTR
jgi:hypothetical protein